MEKETNEDEEMVEVNVLEFGLDEGEINELISELENLKETKSEFSFEVDEENELLIKYENSEEEEE